MSPRYSLFALLALFAAAPAFAQQRLHTGWATDPQTGEPVAFSTEAPPAYDAKAQREGDFELVLLDHWAEGATKVARVQDDVVFYQNGALLISARIEGDPLGLTPLDTVALAGQPGDVALYQDYAYVGLRKGRGLSVIDVSDPAAMEEVGRVDDGREGISVAAADGALYLGMGTAGVAVYSLASPEAPAFERAFGTPGSANGLAVANDVLYVADGNGGLRAYDLDDALDPATLWTLETEGFVTGVTATDDVVYVTGGFGLLLVDVSDFETPNLVATLSLGDETTYEAALSGEVIYVAGLGGVFTVDVADPEAPAILDQTADGQQELAVAVAGQSVLVSDRFRGLRVLDAASLDQTALVRNGGFSARGTLVTGEAFGEALLYVVDLSGALRIFSVSGDGIFGDLGTGLLSVTDVPPNAQEVEVRGGRAYVTDSDFGGTGLTILDVSDPQAPTVLSTIGFDNQAFGLDVVGTTVYLCNGFSGLVVLDAADPQNVVELGSFAFAANANDVVVDAENEIAYVVSFGGGMRSLDVSDPANIAELDAKAWGFLNAVAFEYEALVGDENVETLYVADGQQGLRLVDATDPSSLETFGTIPTASQARDVSGGTAFELDIFVPVAYVADDFFGMRLFYGILGTGFYESADRGFGVATNRSPGCCSNGPEVLFSGETGIYFFQGVTTVSAEPEAEASSASLQHVRPNPTAHSASVPFSLSGAGAVRLEAFDVLGRRVAVLHDGPLPSGEHERTFDASGLPAGVYVIRLQTETGTATTRVTVVR
jgi:hypothetical protein